ncbi:mucin-3A-like [Anopheles aquasalis]|uniref:mucin-3A-like n=1 Tax=Anopheles aquasalis TaxID=42839 RepID=UPI00215B2FB7|nr:mucin-3A-like [Anopheles aquasalis]
MDDFDIYGDLEKYESEAKKDSEEVQDLLRRIAELEKQLESKEQEKCDVEKKNRILAENISSLLLTAKAELKRKDTVIADLRKQCDNAAFRRGNQGAKPAVGGKKREQATQTSVCHSRHTGVQTDLSKPEECSDRKRKHVRELNGDDEARESKRARVHDHGSSNRDLENDRERRREKDREREKDKYRDRDTDRLRYRDRERSRERVRERSRDRHKPRTSDRDRDGMARRERDPIKDSEASRRSEVTDRKDRNRREHDTRSRPANSSRDQQSKESISSDHKSVPSNVDRKSFSKDAGLSHRTDRRRHSTKSNHADDVRDSSSTVKAHTAICDKIREESDPAVTTLHSPDDVTQPNQKDSDKTIPDTQNAGKFRNDSSSVAISAPIKCLPATLDASEAASQHEPNINEHLITQNNDTNAETCSIVSQSIPIESVHQTPATNFKPKIVTIEAAIVEVTPGSVCVEHVTNEQTTDSTPILSREVIQEYTSEEAISSIDLPETIPTKANGDESESLNESNQTVLPPNQEDCNGDEILESTSQTSNIKTTPEEDDIEHNSTDKTVADSIMDSKSPETPIESETEKDHTMEAKQNDSNINTGEVEAAAEQTISCDRQNDAMKDFTESDLIPAENVHTAKLQLPFKEPTCNFTEWKDDILSSSKYLTKPVHPRIRALVKEAVVFKKALNNLKLASKLTEPIDLTEALVTHRRLPLNQRMCITVQNYPSRKPVTAAQSQPLDGNLNKTTNDKLVPSSNSSQVVEPGSSVTRQYEVSNTRSSNFGNEFLKITSTCTISSTSSMNRMPTAGAAGISLQQFRESSSSEPQASASLPVMPKSGSNYAVYTPWRNYFKDTNVENETIESNRSPIKRATPAEDQPVTLNASNPTNNENSPTCSLVDATTSNADMVDCSLKRDQLTKCSASRTTNVVGQELLSLVACSSTNDVTAASSSGTRDLADSSKQPTTAVAATISPKRRMSVDCLTEDTRQRVELSSTASRSASLSKEFFSSIALPIVSALDFVQPKPRCNTRTKTICSTPKSKASALPQTPPTPMVVLHSPAKSCRTPLKGPPMVESEFDANSSVQNIMDSLLKTPIKTEINDEVEHDGNIPDINESMFSNVSAISHDVLYKSYFSTENPLSAVKSDPEEEKTPVKQACETATVDLVSPWHTAMSSTPVTATKSIARIMSTADANVSAVPTNISSSNILLSNSGQKSPSNSTLEVCIDEDTVPSETSQNITACSKSEPEAVFRQKRRSAKKRKKREKHSMADGHSRRSKKKKQHSIDTSSASSEQTSASMSMLVPPPSTDGPREQIVPQPAQRDYAPGEIIPHQSDTIANDIMLQTIKATHDQRSTAEADVPNVAQSATEKPMDRINLTTEVVNGFYTIPPGGGNLSAPTAGSPFEAATASSTTDKENVPWVKKESILRTPGQFVTPDGPVNFVREMRVVKESPNYMRVYITRKKV